MIYLEVEETMFQDVKARFTEAYVDLLEEMRRVYIAKAKVRDKGTPIHHRQSPLAMLGLAQGKGRRLEALLEGGPEDFNLIIEECVDVANYVLYIGALAILLRREDTAAHIEEVKRALECDEQIRREKEDGL